MQVENEDLFREALSTGLSVFLGAGFSPLANDQKGRPLPVGDQLKSELMTEFDLTDLQTLDLAQVCAVIESTHKAELRSYLTQRFSVGQFDRRYLSLGN